MLSHFGYISCPIKENKLYNHLFKLLLLLLNWIAHECAYRYCHTGRLGLCLATLFRVFTNRFSSLCAPFNVVSLTLPFTQITHTGVRRVMECLVSA